MSLLARNLEALGRRAVGPVPGIDNLADVIKSGEAPAPASRLRILTAADGSPTLLVDGLSLHSRYDPVKEAEAAAEREMDPGATAAIVLGFGLGYLAEAVNRRHPRLPLLVVEPDADVFRAALSCRDLSALLSSPEVTICLEGTPDGLPRLLEAMPLARPSLLRLRPAFQKNPAYRAADETVQSWLLRRDINTNTLARFGRLWVRNLSRNMLVFAVSPGIGALSGHFDGIPALVVAGGPSLDALSSLLPRLRERMLVVAVNTALRPCLQAGVEPDFTVVVDPQFWASRYLDWAVIRHGCIVAEPSTCPRVFHGIEAPVFLCSSLFPLGEALEAATGRRGALGAGGSVATSAWDLGRLLGCRPLYAGGLDLGFPGMKTHCRGVFIEETWTVSARRLDPVEGRSFRALHDVGLFPVRSTAGGVTPTDRRMLLYKWWFENQLVMRPEIPAFTLSPEGTAIEGMGYADPSRLLELPVRREEIDARMKRARAIHENRPPLSDAAVSLRAALGAVSAGLGELESLAHRGVEEIGLLDAALGRGADPRQHVEALDRIDTAILGISARSIAGFLIQSIIHRIEGEGGASAERGTVVERSRSIYGGIAESARWQRDLLRRADRDLEGGSLLS